MERNPRRIVFFSLALCPPNGFCLNYKHNVLKGRGEEKEDGRKEDADISTGQLVSENLVRYADSALEALRLA